LIKSVQNKKRNKVNYGYPEQTFFSISEPVTDVGHKAQTVVRPQFKKKDGCIFRIFCHGRMYL
jgi:hypothetical protein